MKVISVFNNKGGVGKTTLTYHLAHMLAEMGKKILILDLDSQCNISLYGMQEAELEKIWKEEDIVIEKGLESAEQELSNSDFKKLFDSPRTMHFLLKSVEEGISDYKKLPPPYSIAPNLDLIPSRLTLFNYENKISERWNGMYLGESLPIRTITRIKDIAKLYAKKNKYNFIIIDTSPSLGALNKVVISTADGFIIPCSPDVFSLYGIKNIGEALTQWQREFETCFHIISKNNREKFPEKLVRFLGYTIYNAKKRSDASNEWNLAKAHYDYAKQIPETIIKHIDSDIRKHLSNEMVKKPIGGRAVMHSHNTLANNAQKQKKPVWKVANKTVSKKIKENYKKFAKDFLKRVKTLDDI